MLLGVLAFHSRGRGLSLSTKYAIDPNLFLLLLPRLVNSSSYKTYHRYLRVVTPTLRNLATTRNTSVVGSETFCSGKRWR